MSPELEAVRAMLVSAATNAVSAIDKAAAEVRGQFSKAGRFGSPGMRRAIEQRVTEVFRDEAHSMALKARKYAGRSDPDLCELVDDELAHLIDSIISNYFKDGADASFKPELVRHKDDAVRDCRHMPLDAAGASMAVHVADNRGNINIAGPGGTASQAVRGARVAEILDLIATLKRVIDTEPMAEVQRLELQDHVEALEIEASKPAPNQGKLVRTVRRLGEFAEKATVAAVAPTVTALIKHLGG
jgi:hypothetical protein